MTDTSTTPREDPLWRQVLDNAFNHDDGTWQIGEGGDWLLELLITLMHPADGAGVPALSDEQLRVALEQVRATGGRS